MFKLCMVVAMAALLQVERVHSSQLNGTISEESKSEAGSGGYIIVAGGGIDSDTFYTSSCFAFDINSGTWSALPNLPTARSGGGLVNHQGLVYYAAGISHSGGMNNVLLLSNEWIEGPPLRSIAWSGVNAITLNNSLYVLGGDTNSLERYSCGERKYVWSEMASTLQPHFFNGAAALNGKIYVCGPSTFCECYDPSTNRFAPIKPMNEARKFFSMVSLKGYLYVIGGAEANNERYDPSKDEWTYFSSVIDQTYYQTAATDGERIYAVGGVNQDSCGYSNQLSVYVPELDVWLNKVPYPLQICQASATFVKELP